MTGEWWQWMLMGAGVMFFLCVVGRILAANAKDKRDRLDNFDTRFEKLWNYHYGLAARIAAMERDMKKEKSDEK